MIFHVMHKFILHLQDRKSLFELCSGPLMDKQTPLKRRLDIAKTIFD